MATWASFYGKLGDGFSTALQSLLTSILLNFFLGGFGCRLTNVEGGQYFPRQQTCAETTLEVTESVVLFILTSQEVGEAFGGYW